MARLKIYTLFHVTTLRHLQTRWANWELSKDPVDVCSVRDQKLDNLLFRSGFNICIYMCVCAWVCMYIYIIWLQVHAEFRIEAG